MANEFNPIQPVELRPAARSTDVYAGPPRSRLRDFAASLAGIDSELQTFINDRAEKFRAEQAIRGEAAFQSDNQIGYAEAVRQGLIPAHSSGSFVRAYKASEGALAGQRLKAAYSAAYEAWDGKYSEDPAAYEQFFTDFVAKNVGTQDPDVLRGLLPHVRELQQNGYAQHTADLSKSVYDGSVTSHVAQANRDIEEANNEGLVTGKGTDYESVWAAIEVRRKSFVDSGGDPKDFDTAMVQAMQVKILTTRDPALLKWFDQKVPGEDYTYGETPLGQKVKLETENQLETIARQEMSDEKARMVAEDKAGQDKAWSEAIDLIAADPTAVIPDELMARGIKYDPKFRVNVESWRKSLGEGFSDPAAIKQVYVDILNGGGIKIVRDAMDNGIFGRPEDLTAAMTFAKGYEDNKARIEDAMGSGSAKSIMQAIDIRTKGKDNIGQPIGGTSNEGFEAQFDFSRMVQEWVIQHPDATMAEREQAIASIGKIVLDNITAPKSILEGGLYNQPGELAGAYGNPFSPPPPAPQPAPAKATPPGPDAAAPAGGGAPGASNTDAATQGGASTASPAPKVAPGAVVPAYEINGEALTAEQYKQVEAAAAASGLTTEAMLAQMGAKPVAQTEAAPKQGELATTEQTSQAIGNAKPSSVIFSGDPNAPSLSVSDTAKAIGEAGLGSLLERNTQQPSGFTPEGAGAGKGAGGGGGAGMELGPDEFRILDRYAREAGKPLNEIIDLYRAGRIKIGSSDPGFKADPVAYRPGDQYNPQTDDGAGDRRASEFSSEEALSLINQALQSASSGAAIPAGGEGYGGDAFAANLGNFIVSKEAGGNWNAVFGKANSKVDLAQFSLDEVLAQQQAARKAGAISTAIGGPQFLYKTLRGLKDEMGLTGTEKFTPALQQQMLVHLLNRRGYQQFKAGLISKEQFALRLSQEWASLPNPATGLSYYAGDGINSALTSTAAVYKALGFSGTGDASWKTAGGNPPSVIYANIPAAERDQFMEWNPDPVGNQEKNLSTINPTLADVVRKAQSNGRVKFVVASGARTAEQQRKAVEWGWSKTMHSDHMDANAVDLWPLDANGSIKFDPQLQKQLAEEMKIAAKELGVTLDVGAEWRNKDLPHFGIKVKPEQRNA